MTWWKDDKKMVLTKRPIIHPSVMVQYCTDVIVMGLNACSSSDWCHNLKTTCKEGRTRWDNKAKPLLTNHIEKCVIDISNIDKITPGILNFYDEESFSEYHDLPNKQRKHQAFKCLKNTLANYKMDHLPKRTDKFLYVFMSYHSTWYSPSCS